MNEKRFPESRKIKYAVMPYQGCCNPCVADTEHKYRIAPRNLLRVEPVTSYNTAIYLMNNVHGAKLCQDSSLWY